jgi:hypothetical protein
MGKISFNHIFNDVKREKEYSNLSKVFKDLSIGKDITSTPTSSSATNVTTTPAATTSKSSF